MAISRLRGGLPPPVYCYLIWKFHWIFAWSPLSQQKVLDYYTLYAPHFPCHLLHVHACVLSCFSCDWVFVTLWTIALQAPLSMGFSRQEYWSRLSCPPPGDLPYPGSQSGPLKCLLHWQAGSLPLVHLGSPTLCIPFFFFFNICLAVWGF